MIGKGSLSLAPHRRLRMMVVAHVTWIAIVCLLGAWWGRLLLTQAGKIVELERSLGWAANLTQDQWHKTQHMLHWEFATFFGLLLACTAFLFWLYWRDVKRARGLQAFFASVTHELRTPLTSIRLQAESIAENLAGESSQKNLVQRLLEDTIRLEAQVERTLELARIEGGGPVQTQTLQIKPWLERFLRSWAADHQNKVELEFKIEDLLIEADPMAMQIILRNLLENSIRHSKQEKVLISISVSPNKNQVCLFLKDNGQGYSGERKNLGKLFQKGSSSQGTGVGLYLVKILKLQWGTLPLEPLVEEPMF